MVVDIPEAVFGRTGAFFRILKFPARAHSATMLLLRLAVQKRCSSEDHPHKRLGPFVATHLVVEEKAVWQETQLRFREQVLESLQNWVSALGPGLKPQAPIASLQEKL